VAELVLVRSMRATVPVITFLAFSYFGCLAAGAGVSPFDGVWKREWSNTTPRGVHQVGSHIFTIRTTGISSDSSTLTLTQTIGGVTKTLRLVQSCKATKTEVKGRTLTIHWSEVTLLSPKPSEIPSGLHLWTAPVTRTYTIRGKALLVTTGKATNVFYRVATARPNHALQPTPSRLVSFPFHD
jgi:hypothetical protein